VQRLFSTFPRSWPGVGLLVLRCSLGLALLSSGIGGFSETASDVVVFAQRAAAILGGVFLFAGLWTPFVGVLVALDEISIALLADYSEPGGLWIHAFLAVVSVSLAMLGPGAWSVDSRMFGRRRLDLDPGHRGRSL
jgi:putative oxidoreductase